MDIFITKVAAALILPPSGNFLLAVVGLALWQRRRLLAVVLLATSIVTLFLFSMPIVGNALYTSLETYPVRFPGTPIPADVGAIVVLAGGRSSNAPEYGGETVSSQSLVRLRYAARLHRETGLPLLVSGGSVRDEQISEAVLMKDVLEQELGAPVRWLEERSRNTAENARYSADLLRGENITVVILVTHAAHMPRAVEQFYDHGVSVVARPTGKSERGMHGSLLEWIPSAGGLEASRAAMHEYVGRIWYRIRY